MAEFSFTEYDGECRCLTRRLHRVLHDMDRIRQSAMRQKRASSLRPCSKKQGTTELPPVSVQKEQGEYRTFYISPVHLLFEKEYFKRHNVNNIIELLDIAGDILASYSGLIREMDDGSSPYKSTLSSMGEVMQIALDAVYSARELYENMELVQDE